MKADPKAARSSPRGRDAGLVARLQQGLWLERRGVLLPWHATLDKLRALGNPVIERPSRTWPERVDLVWRDDAILDGLAMAELRTGFDPKTGRLNRGAIYGYGPDYAVWGDPASAFAGDHAHLCRVLGPPDRRGPTVGGRWPGSTVEVALVLQDLNNFYYSDSLRKLLTIAPADGRRWGSRSEGSPGP